MLGNALDEDLGRLNLASLDTEQDADVDSNSLCSPLSSSLSGPTSTGMLHSSVLPCFVSFNKTTKDVDCQCHCNMCASTYESWFLYAYGFCVR